MSGIHLALLGSPYGLAAPTTVEYLVVAGGGGGGLDGYRDTYQAPNPPGYRGYGAGGGGAGGYRTSSSFSVATSTTYTVTVGGGGASGSNGSDSVFSTVTSTGGGRGGSYFGNPGPNGGDGSPGGSGGGNSIVLIQTPNYYNQFVYGFGNTPNTSPSQGNPGENTAGLSGARGGGSTAPYSGTANSISGASVTYAAGGGSGTSGANGPSGAVNSGDGGTAGLADNDTLRTGGSGGSGIVIISYPDSFALAKSTTGSPTVTTSGGKRIYKFTGSGSISW